MYAYGTDLSKLPMTDTLQPNPQYKPPTQTNTQKNDQQYGQGQWAYSQSQQPAKQTDMSAYGGGSQGGYGAYANPSSGSYGAYSNPYGSGQQSYSQTQSTTQQMPGYQTNYQGQQSPWSGQIPNPQTTPTFTSQAQSPFGSMDPSQFYAQRDALISKLNDYSNGYAMQSGTSMDGSFGPAPVAPNFQNMWSQAGDMVKGGWQNPFAAPQTSGILSQDAYGTGLGEFGNTPMQPYGGSPQPAVAPKPRQWMDDAFTPPAVPKADPPQVSQWLDRTNKPQPAVAPPAPSPVGAAQPIQPPSQGIAYTPKPADPEAQKYQDAEKSSRVNARRKELAGAVDVYSGKVNDLLLGRTGGGAAGDSGAVSYFGGRPGQYGIGKSNGFDSAEAYASSRRKLTDDLWSALQSGDIDQGTYDKSIAKLGAIITPEQYVSQNRAQQDYVTKSAEWVTKNGANNWNKNPYSYAPSTYAPKDSAPPSGPAPQPVTQVGQAQPIQPPSQGTPYNPQPDWDRIYKDRLAREEQGRKIQAERDAQDQRAREYEAAHPRAPGPKAESMSDRLAAIKASQDARPTAAKYADWTRPKRRKIS
jgi:hypothetical protein